MRIIDADALLSDIERTIEASGCVNHEGEIMETAVKPLPLGMGI